MIAFWRQVARSGQELRMRISGSAVLVAVLLVHADAQPTAYNYRKVMVPVRDGIRLETVILTPAAATAPLPILLRRTPYGVPANGARFGGGSLAELARDGYIFVVQNLRGRFESGGM